jgi:dienelactone hydrolase
VAAAVAALAGCGAGRTPGRSAVGPLPPPPVVTRSTAPRPSVTAPAPATVAAALPALRAPLPTITGTITVVDATRPTVRLGQAVSPVRTLPTTIVRPSAGGKWPLVVFAHGYNVGPDTYAHLIDAIAAAGYVVAAPVFPLTNSGAGPLLDEDDIQQQPGDVRAVITEVERRSATIDGLLGGRVIADRVAVVGHSDGAETALGTGFDGPADPHLRAVVALAGSPIDNGAALARAVPLLVAQGDADRVNPPAEGAKLYATARAPRAYLSLIGAGHLPAVAQATPWRPVVEREVVHFLDLEVAGRVGARAALVRDGDVAGVSALTVDL